MKPFSWQQPFRAIAEILNTENNQLKKIYILPSKKSYKQYDYFVQFLQNLNWGDGIKFEKEEDVTQNHDHVAANQQTIILAETDSNGLDYDNPADVFEKLESIVKKEKRKEEQNIPAWIGIDITGGQRVFSAMASLVGIKPAVCLIYTKLDDSNNEGYKVNFYEYSIKGFQPSS